MSVSVSFWLLGNDVLLLKYIYEKSLNQTKGPDGQWKKKRGRTYLTIWNPVVAGRIITKENIIILFFKVFDAWEDLTGNSWKSGMNQKWKRKKNILCLRFDIGKLLWVILFAFVCDI